MMRIQQGAKDIYISINIYENKSLILGEREITIKHQP